VPTLEELLRASLQGANRQHNEADADLHREVVAAARAVEAVTDGRATLRLIRSAEDRAATGYDLCVVAIDGSEPRKIDSFTVTERGYPIMRHVDLFETAEEKFRSADEVNGYFRKLAADPDSLLVAYLAYYTRQPRAK
jgi:hypothetical protein